MIGLILFREVKAKDVDVFQGKLMKLGSVRI